MQTMAGEPLNVLVPSHSILSLNSFLGKHLVVSHEVDFVAPLCYSASMKKRVIRFALAASLAVLLVILTGCVGGKALRTESVGNSDEITGPFTLILYHEAIYDGLKTLAFLVPEENGYTLEPYVPAYDYTVTKGVSGQDALRSARAFVSGNPAHMRNEVLRILDPAGNTIAYEVRPLYFPMSYGVDDVMIVSYTLTDGKTIRVDIWLVQSVKDQFTGGRR